MNIIKVSPKGQITIPKKARAQCDSGQYFFEMNGKTIVLRPVTIRIERNDLGDFSALAEKAFKFWSNDTDDVYQQFYKD